MSDKPAIDCINDELQDTLDQSAAKHEQINDIANEQEFNWWWYKIGTGMEPREGEDPELFINRIARASYMHARSLPALPPCGIPPQISPSIAGLWALFALGVVAGISIAILTAIFILN